MKKGFQERLHDEIERIISRSDAAVGICAIHLESGARVAVNADRSFALASVYKIPIAMRLLKLVEQGRCALDRMIEIAPEDVSPGSSPIKDFLRVPGVQLSVRNLLELTIRFSDNTASDIVLRLAGGCDEVTTMLRSAGIDDLRVDRSTKQLLCDFSGLSELASQQPWSLKQFQARFKETTEAQRKAALEAFLADQRDHGTASGLAALLARLQNGDLVGRAHADLLLGVMRRCQTGPERLKGQLPAGTVVAHKTGTLEGVLANDAGIVELPDDRGRVAIAALAESTERTTAELELTIARIARSIYDGFLLAD